MKLLMKPQTVIRDLNRVFTKEFPFLKLQFYKSLDTDPRLSYIEHRASDNLRLSDVCASFKEGAIEIDPFQTVAELEQEFQSAFGLTVQVIRKTGEVWLETRQTDNLSLDYQNSIGAESARPIRINRYTLFL
jgi:hypothetical protein